MPFRGEIKALVYFSSLKKSQVNINNIALKG